MPRIAFVLQTFYDDHIGGAERQVQLLARGLRDQGWETIYICERSTDKPRREVVNGMEVLALPLRKRRNAWLNFSALKEAMIKSRADLFYQRVRRPYTGLVVRIARKLKKPVVYAVASIADVNRRRDLFRKMNSGSPIDLLINPFLRYVENWGITNADAIILQTQDQLRLLESEYKRGGTVIPNHLFLENDQPNVKISPPEILWISNIKQMKRPELFVELAHRCHDLDVRFIMAGSCEQDKFQHNIAEAERKLSNFFYIGPLKPSEAEKRIASAALLINTSEFEGFPNVLQQAWAKGVPTLCLGIDPDGIIEREGLGVNAKSVDELEAALRRLLSDDEQRESIGERAREFARRSYDLKNLLPRYVALFEDLIRT